MAEAVACKPDSAVKRKAQEFSKADPKLNLHFSTFHCSTVFFIYLQATASAADLSCIWCSDEWTVGRLPKLGRLAAGWDVLARELAWLRAQLWAL